jgi:hypothetical protein
MKTIINKSGVKITVETDQNVTITEKQIIIDLVQTVPTTPKVVKRTNKTKKKYMTKSLATDIMKSPKSYSKTLVKSATKKLASKNALFNSAFNLTKDSKRV